GTSTTVGFATPPASKRRQCRAGRLKRPEREATRFQEGSRAREDQTMAKRKKPLVVVTRKLPDRVETRMRELFDAQLNLDDKPMSPVDLAEAMKAAHVLVPTITDRIDAAVIGKAGDQLKLIANFGTGVDNIDVKAAHARGMMV